MSIYIEQAGKNILLDTGASNRFLVNAKALEKDIGAVDYGVLSHAHYDHANGMQAFFEENENAKFYLQKGTGENCYFKKWFIHKYIGIPKHILTRQKDRIEYVTGKYKLYKNVYLIPHTTKGLETIGAANKMYIRDGRRWRPDDFAHEQSLVIEEEDGLIIFNSCSHGGADNIINEVSKLFVIVATDYAGNVSKCSVVLKQPAQIEDQEDSKAQTTSEPADKTLDSSQTTGSTTKKTVKIVQGAPQTVLSTNAKDLTTSVLTEAEQRAAAQGSDVNIELKVQNIDNSVPQMDKELIISNFEWLFGWQIYGHNTVEDGRKRIGQEGN